MRRGLCLLLAVLLTLSAGLCASAKTVEECYEDMVAAYPEFVDAIVATGKVEENDLLDYVFKVYNSFLTLNDVYGDVTEETFDENFKDIVQATLTKSNLYYALLEAYPDAIRQALDGVIAPEFQPLYQTMKDMVFRYDLLNPTTEEPTAEPTEPPTAEPTAEPTTDPTAEPTTDPVDPSTDPTEEPTQAPTKDSGGGSTGGGGSGTGSADPTEPTTESTTTPSGETTTEGATETTTEVFSDLATVAWAKDAIASLVSSGVLSGYADGTFRPDNAITRAEFAKVLVVAADVLDTTLTADFSDVAEDAWYAPYVASAKAAGLVMGNEDGTFAPDTTISRADICVMVYRYLQSKSMTFDMSETRFADDADIPTYASEAIYALTGAGVLSGVGDNRFAPGDPATRAQAAKILDGALQLK